ncbi:HlyD family secretion protein [Roseibium aggregatum]|uniref:HlyD family efflux transporter periplasmic adaptor subunit n=1 Tax=Roseibium aggregatum TaxID=187304 RepID=A0A939ECG3_9HYPH|nr:HlyD family efflux transporter periplasmic adaptor subunit [Roseibium aggregatum]MBN9669533.1 HlyD family efflux transporter periplasmic adaptor subunit [Roseibium aggregatum]
MLATLFRTARIGAASLMLASCFDETGGVALGSLERDRVALSATAAEVLIDLPVPQGTFVEKGTVLARLDPAEQQAVVNQARAEVQKAQANLLKLENGAREEEIATARANVAGAKAELAEAEATFTRYSDLTGRGTTSQAQLDSARAARDAKDASLKSAEQQLKELVTGTRPEDLEIAKAELAAAKASLESQEKILSDLTITASRDGVLDNLPWNLGERVSVGSPVAIMLAGDAPYARVYVPEPYRVRVKEGDRLEVRIDGLADPIEGTVRWISSEPSFTPYYALNQTDRSRLMYVAEVQLPDSASDLPNGVPAQVLLP